MLINNGKKPESDVLRARHEAADPKARRRYILFWALAALMVAIIMAECWPVKTLETPRWDVWVVDEDGNPLEGMTVALMYHNSSAETEGHSEELITGADGHVVFPPRTIRVSTWKREFAIARTARSGAHARFGPHAGVFTFGHGLAGFAVSSGIITDWTGEPAAMESRIVAKPKG
ncbi:MAG: hypothetical protein WAO35_11580 [Terriglobia bacterium]